MQNARAATDGHATVAVGSIFLSPSPASFQYNSCKHHSLKALILWTTAVYSLGLQARGAEVVSTECSCLYNTFKGLDWTSKDSSIFSQFLRGRWIWEGTHHPFHDIAASEHQCSHDEGHAPALGPSKHLYPQVPHDFTEASHIELVGSSELPVVMVEVSQV